MESFICTLYNYNYSIQEKDEKLRTVEELLETGLIQVATREEELTVRRFLLVSLCSLRQPGKASWDCFHSWGLAF